MDANDAGGQREQRFIALFTAYRGQVLDYVRRRLPDDLADDAVADTFLAAWINLERCSNDPLLWLYGIARGAVANHRRRLGRAARLNERTIALHLSASSPDHAEVVGWQDAFAAAFEQLSERDREALRLTVWEGLSPSDGATVLGCSVSAFKVRLHRARRRLRHLLDADEAGGTAGHETNRSPLVRMARDVSPCSLPFPIPLLAEPTIATSEEMP